MTKKKIFYLGGTLITIIIIISIFFHYPIHITDALTLKTLPEYDFHIPVVKILFEPLLGTLLFFNRAVYALEEQQFLLIWILGLFSLYSIVKFFILSDIKAKKQFILRQLSNLPLIIGLWLTFFIIMLFIPLPNNTIINNSEHSILVTTHTHSQFSHDGLIRQKALWEWHKRNGFDAFFITDHGTNHETMDFLTAQRKGDFPIEPLIMCGEEYSATNHFSLLGFKKSFNTDGYSDTKVIDSLHAQKGVVIVNHWFDDENKSLEYYKSVGVDGFEIENAGSETSYNRELYQKIKTFCESNNLIMVAGLDFHGYGNACTMWNALEIPDWHTLTPAAKEQAILDVFRSRDQSKIKVLVYTDRPYYGSENLFWSPFSTMFNYFRTLNIWQVLSWIFWVFFISFVKIKMLTPDKLSHPFSTHKILPVIGVLSALFLLALGTTFYGEIQNVLKSKNDIYVEYSTLLFYVGSVFLVYASIVTWFRIFRK